MFLGTAATLLCLCAAARAHGNHGEKQADVDKEGYIKAHMQNEHHIDTFDLKSFFLIHDLDRDGFWDRGEIEAVYGVHHDWNPKDKDLAKIKEKADQVVARVLKLLDKDSDNRISAVELEAAGFDGLPNLKDLGAEGHHYDVESEFFLHHEELYHSSPDTQTDEAYNHPEDDEHFANHEHIEAEEERRERAFQGLPEDGGDGHGHEHAATQAESKPSEFGAPTTTPDASAPDTPPPPPPIDPLAHPHDDQNVFQEPEKPKPKIVRSDPPEKQNPTVRFKEAKNSAESKPEWGKGDDGYKRPKTPADKLRRNVPYKVTDDDFVPPARGRERMLTGSSRLRKQYKFKRNWGDF